MRPRYQRQRPPLARRDLLLIIISGVVIVGVIVGLIVFLTGPRPPKVGQTTSLPATSSLFAPIGTPTATETPTEVPTIGPTATLEPYQYQIKQGDTLGFIVQVFGYRDTSIYPEIQRLNNLSNPNILPPAGSILLIPRQTPTAGPSATPTIEGTPAGPTPDYHGCSSENRCVSPDGKYWVYEVKEGDTILLIASEFITKPNSILPANGLPENSFLHPGQILLIPILVTLTPTLTPTGGPESTATPTPTYGAPSLLSPTDGAKLPRGQTVVLQWVTVHPLAENEYYLVILRNTDTGQESKYLTRANSYRLPGDIQPGLGQSARFEWQVVVVAGANPNAPPVSGQDAPWVFIWGP